MMSLKGKGKASNLVSKAKEEDTKSAFASAKAKAFNQRKRLMENESAYMLCGISGDPGTGKTGLAIDCRTDEEKETHWVFILDFDEGAEPTWRQHWSSDDKVFIYTTQWYARTEEYKRLFKAACQLQCHKFFITHMKEVHDGFEVVGQKPDWEKSTTAKLFQHIHTYREERNNTTKLHAKVLKSKTNADNEGQSFLLFENEKGNVTWNGLVPIKENNL